MAFEPQPPFPKSRGDSIRSGDWNELISETQRLDNAKVNRSGDAISGPLTVAGALGIGTATPRQPLEVFSSGADEAPILALSTPNTEDFLSIFAGRRNDQSPFLAWKRGDLRIGTANNFIGSGFSEKLRITSSGNVGIATSSPYTTLTISGSIGFTNGTTPMLYINQTGTANPERPIIAHSPPFPNWGLSYRDTTDTMIFQGGGTPVLTVGLGSGLVGIGTDSPGFKLDVTDRIRLRAGPNGSAGHWLFQANSDRAFIGLVNDNTMGFWGSGVGWALQMDVNDGTVYIGANKSGLFARFNDDLWFSDPQNGTVQTRNGPNNNFGTMVGFFQAPSSRAFKKEIEVLQGTELEQLFTDTLRTDLVRFRYNGDDSTKRSRLGVIAEDAPQVIVGHDGESLAIPEYIAMLHGALKVLSNRFADLVAANQHLQSRSDRLETNLQQLEGQLQLAIHL